MKISAVTTNIYPHRYAFKKESQNKTQNNNFEFSDGIKNYSVPFMGLKNNKNRLPDPDNLKVNVIEECNPVPDDMFDTERLSGVLSTAMRYLKEDCPLVLACSDRRMSQNFILDAFDNDELFDGEKEIKNIIFVEDDRIIDEPIMFVKEKNKIYVIGNVQIINKSDYNVTYANKYEKTPFSLNNDIIKLYKTDIDSISAGEIPDRVDLQFIKKFKIEDATDMDFRNTGDIQSGEFTTVPPKSKYKVGNYPMFSDIGGNKEAIQRIIEDIFAPMAYPEIFGHVMNKGTLLEGPPGTGKSMLGKALGNELSNRLGETVHLQEISGAEMQIAAVGGSEAKWRALFETAIDNQPALILIDEIDACLPKRDGSSNARYDNSVVNQLLSLMSDLEKSDNKVYVIGMTNRPEAIDPAMLRSGRFGNVIPVPAPTYDEAEEIFDKVSQKYNFDKSFDKKQMLNRIIKIKGTGSTISGVLENAQKFSNRRNGIYASVLAGTLTKDEKDNCVISMDDIIKGFEYEEDKNKKAKISSDRVVIKGFRR